MSLSIDFLADNLQKTLVHDTEKSMESPHIIVLKLHTSSLHNTAKGISTFYLFIII